MIIVPTQKLFYNRFTYCIKLNVIKERKKLWEGDRKFGAVKQWLTDNAIPNRTRFDWYNKDANMVDITLGICFNDESAYSYIINNCKDNIKWVSKPADDAHKELLLNKTEIEFREKLYFKNFRYKILFNTGWKREERDELINHIKDHFVGQVNGRKNDYFFVNNWTPLLYIKDESDMIMIKLKLSDDIRKVVKVELFEEHGVESTLS